MKLTHKNRYQYLAVGIVSMTLVGCMGGKADSELESAATSNVKDDAWKPNSPAGLEVTTDTNAKKFSNLVASNSTKWGPSRANPFALTATESAFDYAQESERNFSTIGGFTTRLEAKVAPDDVLPTIEAQPYRRLAGVVVGDSVVAIIEMGNGVPAQVIRPGMKISGTEWTVVSIDQEKAILRRDGNVQPKEVAVRLEISPAGSTSTNSGAGFGGPNGGGFPGGPGGPGRPGGMGAPGGRGGFGGKGGE